MQESPVQMSSTSNIYQHSARGGLYLYFIRVELHTVRDSSQTGGRSGKKTDCRRTIDIGSK